MANTLGLRFVFGFSTRQIRPEKISDGRGRGIFFLLLRHRRRFLFSFVHARLPRHGRTVNELCKFNGKEKKYTFSSPSFLPITTAGMRRKRNNKKRNETKLNASSPFNYCLERTTYITFPPSSPETSCRFLCQTFSLTFPFVLLNFH